MAPVHSPGPSRFATSDLGLPLCRVLAGLSDGVLSSRPRVRYCPTGDYQLRAKAMIVARRWAFCPADALLEPARKPLAVWSATTAKQAQSRFDLDVVCLSNALIAADFLALEGNANHGRKRRLPARFRLLISMVFMAYRRRHNGHSGFHRNNREERNHSGPSD